LSDPPPARHGTTARLGDVPQFRAGVLDLLTGSAVRTFLPGVGGPGCPIRHRRDMGLRHVWATCRSSAPEHFCSFITACQHRRLAVLIGFHPIVEALRTKRPLERILVARGLAGPRIQEVIDLAREAGTPIRFEERSALDRLATVKAHQGVIALAAAKKYAELSDVAPESKLLVVLDGVEDPHNLGAIIRTAHAAGAGAVIIPERRAAGLTDVVAKAAAGALEHLPIVREGNINHALRSLKDMGYFVYGLDERGTTAYNQVKWPDRCVIVMGAEGHGLHDLVKKNCDMLLRIPMAGKIASLNVSVATGVVLFDWLERASPGAELSVA
jgi:23S rRNA (guanosine2251-2'-O)-methyltransferase